MIDEWRGPMHFMRHSEVRKESPCFPLHVRKGTRVQPQQCTALQVRSRSLIPQRNARSLINKSSAREGRAEMMNGSGAPNPSPSVRMHSMEAV